MVRLYALLVTIILLLTTHDLDAAAPAEGHPVIDATSLHGKVMCGYQGWFRCPGDDSQLGWIHWSRDSKRITPDTLSFELWPDMSDYSAAERYPAPGFAYPDGKPAYLFSSSNARTVLHHFEWMRDYGLDGAWLQHFVVDLPGGTIPDRYPSRLQVLHHVQNAARQTGRVWALSYDIAGMPTERIFDTLTNDWKKMVDAKITADARYLHNKGQPVVQIWGFYYHNKSNLMTAELANKLIGFFKSPGPYAAFLVGGGDWDWRRNPDPQWQAMYRRLPAYVPWNIGNYSLGGAGLKSASTQTWEDDKRDCEQRGAQWIPSVYAGFSWDNLTGQAPGTSLIPRRGGQFLWEQFYALAKLKVDSVYIGMFDEVDEGTAIFKVTSAPPTQGHFVGYEGLPSDWYLRLAGEGARMLHGQCPLSAAIPIQP